MRKIFMFIFLFSSAVVLAQEQTEVGQEKIVYAEDIIEAKTRHSIEWMLSFEPIVILNTYDVKKSAPSPVVHPFSIGIVFPAEKFLSFQPRLSVFANYFLWDSGHAYPAEIENRTATAFNFLLDFPAVFKFLPAERHIIECGTGLSFLCRFAKVSNGVSGSDSGASGGSVSDDVAEINRWFWKDANFLYISFSAGYLFKFTGKIKAGPEFKFYLPCGSVFTGRGMNNAMFSAGIRARF